MTTEIQNRKGERVVFTHADIARMTTAFHTGGRQDVYKTFPDIRNDVLDAKLVELGIMEKPTRPALDPQVKQSVVGEIIDAIDARVPAQHQAEAVRAIMLALRDRYIPKRIKENA